MLISPYYRAFSLPSLLSPRDSQAGWITPQPGADFTQTWFKGDILPITWDGWPSSTINEILTTDVADLWITSFYVDHGVFTLLLETNVNVSLAGSLDWTVDGTNIDSAMAERTEFLFRFLPPGDTFIAGTTVHQFYSAGFYLRSTSSSSPSTSSSSTSSSSIYSSPPPSSSPLSSSAPSSSPLSSSAPSSSPPSSSPPSSPTPNSSIPSSSTPGSSTPSSSTLGSSTPGSSTPSSSVSQTSGSAAFTSSASTSPPASQSSVPAITADPISKATASSGLSTSAKIGVGIGCGIAGIAVLFAVYAFGRRRRNLPFTPSIPFSGIVQRESFKPIPPTELHGQTTINELLERDHRRYYAELPTR